MTTKTRFTMDNTEGYTETELSALNAEWTRRGGPGIVDKSEVDHLAEAILRDRDSRSRADECSCGGCEESASAGWGSDRGKADDLCWTCYDAGCVSGGRCRA